MMSLFTNFDMFFVGSKFMYLLLVLNFCCFLLYKTNKMTSVEKMIKGVLENLYYPLKNEHFNKKIFMVILNLLILLMIVNFLSIMPFNFCWTTQISIVFMICLSIWISLNMFMIFKNLKNFISHCIPEGTPIYLTWLLFFIEIVSNVIRPITLSVRLVANILAGHLLMILLASLVLEHPMSMFFYLILTAVEVFVAFIQAYIFVTMMTLYYAETN